MEKLVIFALFVGVALANFYESTPYEKVIRGARSASHDDAMARAHCRKGYLLAKCGCEPEHECDGSWIRSDDDGEYCAAYNAIHGKGVRAVAHCQQLLVFVDSEYGSMPSVACPDHYKLVGCQLHTYLGQVYTDVYAKRHKHSCYTSNGCDHCRVQARCIRNQDYGIE